MNGSHVTFGGMNENPRLTVPITGWLLLAAVVAWLASSGIDDICEWIAW